MGARLAGQGWGWPGSSPSLSPRSPPLSPPHLALLREPYGEQLRRWILRGRRRGKRDDDSGRGQRGGRALRCRPSAGSLRTRSLQAPTRASKGEITALAKYDELLFPTPAKFLVFWRGTLEVVELLLSTPPPFKWGWELAGGRGGGQMADGGRDILFFLSNTSSLL